MTQLTPLMTADARPADVAIVKFFDPPMCCPTGLCGPTLDETLLDVNEMILALQAEGIGVVRYQWPPSTASPIFSRSPPPVTRLSMG